MCTGTDLVEVDSVERKVYLAQQCKLYARNLPSLVFETVQI